MHALLRRREGGNTTERCTFNGPLIQTNVIWSSFMDLNLLLGPTKGDFYYPTQSRGTKNQDLFRVHFHNWEKTLGNQRGLERSYKVLLTNIKRFTLKGTKNDQSKKWNGIEWQNRRPCIYNIFQNILFSTNILDWSEIWLNY